MKVSELIDLLRKVPDVSVPVLLGDTDIDTGIVDLNPISGLILDTTSGQIQFCDIAECPPGVKTACGICGIGCQTIWLMHNGSTSKWFDENEYRKTEHKSLCRDDDSAEALARWKLEQVKLLRTTNIWWCVAAKNWPVGEPLPAAPLAF